MRKKLLLLTVCVLLIVSCFPALTLAQGSQAQYSEKPTSGIAAADIGHASDFHTKSITADKAGTYSIQSGAFIASWGCDIAISSGMVRGMGQTVTNQVVETLGYSLDFQMWDGYNWALVQSVSNVAYNDISVESYHFIPAVSGKYYRVVVYHFMSDNGIYDNETSVSPYVYAN